MTWALSGQDVDLFENDVAFHLKEKEEVSYRSCEFNPGPANNDVWEDTRQLIASKSMASVAALKKILPPWTWICAFMTKRFPTPDDCPPELKDGIRLWCQKNLQTEFSMDVLMTYPCDRSQTPEAAMAAMAEVMTQSCC
jgi:hypothetical protein